MSKERITITLDKSLLRFLDRQVADKTYANRSHALEFLTSKWLEGNKYKLR